MHTLDVIQLIRFAMKKFLLLSMIVLSGAVAASAAPSEASRPEYITRIESCEAILQEFMADPATAIPASVLQSAKALVIVNQFKAGFVFGIKDGYGVILVKRADGHWSLPVLIAAGELSFGLQVGASAIETVMVITDEQTPRILFNQRFNVGVDAKAVAGPKLAESEKYDHAMLTAPVLVYTKAKGLYAGATVKAGWLQRSDDVNFILYNTTYTMPELLYSNWVTPIPEVVPLMNYVQKIAP
jgi:lipid-binding SYLF domain-containing protein